GGIVRRVAGEPAGRKVAEARGVECAGRREGGQRFEPPGGARTVEPEVRHRDVHEVRMVLADLAGRESVPALLGGAEVIDQDVGALAEFAEAVPAVRVVEVDDGTALAGVPVEKGKRAVRRGDVARKRRAEPSRIAARRLD